MGSFVVCSWNTGWTLIIAGKYGGKEPVGTSLKTQIPDLGVPQIRWAPASKATKSHSRFNRSDPPQEIPRSTSSRPTSANVTSTHWSCWSTSIPRSYTNIHPTIPLSPNSFALILLRLLTRAFRSNASALAEPAHSLLLRITSPLPSPCLLPLENPLLAGTLGLYAGIASYGVCLHIATTASVSGLKACLLWVH